MAILQSDTYGQDVWSKLYEALKPYAVTKAHFDSLMRFIAPPQKYTSFAITAENLVRVFQALQSINSEFAGDFSPQTRKVLQSELSGWLFCCKAITTNRSSIEGILPGICRSGKEPYAPPYRDYYGSHPLYVTLWCRVLDPELSGRYELAQAYLCLLFMELQNLTPRKLKESESAKDKACLAVRKLARPEFEESLMAFPGKAISLRTLSTRIGSFADDKDIRPFLYLIELALREKFAREKRGRSVVRRSTGTFSSDQQVISFLGDDDFDPVDTINLLSVEKGNKTEKAERKRKLYCGEEFHSSRQFVVTECSGQDPSGGLSEKQRRRMSQGAASAIAMSNQRLPTDWDRLTAYEVATFLERLNDLFSGKVARDESVIGSLELSAYLSIIFWLSAPAEDVQNITIITKAEHCKTDITILLSAKGSAEHWIVNPRAPKLKVIPDKILKPLTLPVAKHYALPIPVLALKTMGAYLMQFPWSSLPIRIFRKDAVDYDLAAKAFLKDLRCRKGGRLSLERVSMHMYGLIAQVPGSDITAAISITRRNDPLGAVPLHYTSNSVDRLRRIYETACNSVLVAAGLRKDSFSAGISSDRYVGSRYVPTILTVQDLVQNLRDRLDVAKEKTSHEIQLHNAMTVYTVMLIGYATGYRAVHDPLLQEAEIDRESGFAVISDKDDDSFYNARIVWLPEICMQQIDLYNKHLAALQRWLFGHNLQLFFDSREKACSGRQINRENPALFLLKKNTNTLPVQPSYLKELLERIKYPLPINANRHFLRTNLLDRGCPVEVIHAFLGHWDRGVEPWGRYSGLSPLVYRDELAKYLIPLLEEKETGCGWTLESGLGSGNG